MCDPRSFHKNYHGIQWDRRSIGCFFMESKRIMDPISHFHERSSRVIDPAVGSRSMSHHSLHAWTTATGRAVYTVRTAPRRSQVLKRKFWPMQLCLQFNFHELKLAFVSRIKFIHSKLSKFSAHVSVVCCLSKQWWRHRTHTVRWRHCRPHGDATVQPVHSKVALL